MIKKVKEKTNFIKEMIKDYRVGALTRSSKFVVNKILKDIDFKKHKVIIEYGPGDGILTKAILKKLPKDGRLIVIETNKEFVSNLNKIDDSRLEVHSEDVRNFLKKQSSLNLEKVDLVISGIPFTFFNLETRKEVVKETFDILNNDGSFVVYQYSLLIMAILKNFFTSVQISFEPRNFLPYFIMKANKK